MQLRTGEISRTPDIMANRRWKIVALEERHALLTPMLFHIVP